MRALGALSCSLLLLASTGPLACNERGKQPEPPPSAEAATRQRDVGNRYSSVVLVKSSLGFCSGVLIAPRLVLTAAHCFCSSAPAASNCSRAATVVSYFYERAGEDWKPTLDTAEGSVVVHENFHGKPRVADLAVVFMEKQLEHAQVDSKLKREEIPLDTELTLVGYGALEARYGGERRAGTNKVSTLRASSGTGWELSFQAPGAHAHAGDGGAPCFLEENGVRWLVGINSGYVSQTAPQSLFTSTASYRGWIEEKLEELQKLEARGATAPKAAPTPAP